MTPTDAKIIAFHRAELKTESKPHRIDAASEKLLGRGSAQWMARYHQRLCRYLSSSLETADEWVQWRHIYTAVHEFLGDVWRQHPPSARKLAERHAWAAFRPLEHSMLGFTTLLPPGTDLEQFLPYYEGFIRFAAEDGAMSEFDAARVVRDVRRFFEEQRPEPFLFFG